MAGTRKSPDLRYLFMRGLISHEDNQRSRHYLKSAAECTSRAIVSLELSTEPIKSVKQARKLEGIGGETCSRLSKLESEKSFSCIKPLGARFVSSTGGILVGLLDATEEILHNGHCFQFNISPDKDVLVHENKVKSRAQRLTEEEFTDGENEFCKAWWRLEVLIKRGYIRRRSLKKSPVLQLLPLGKTTALQLREHVGLVSVVPALTHHVTSAVSSTLSIPQLPELPPSVSIKQSVESGERTQLDPESFSEDSMYTNDKGQEGLVLLVDRREMGGERYGLGELCRLLSDKGICYKTKHLKAGDYCWVWRTSDREIILPCLVERKRADDVACTLKDGRFWTQVNNMKEWKAGFSKKGVESTIHYILERKPEEFVVKCSDGCQGIKKCGNPTLTQVKMVIEDLKHHPDLLVKETPSLEVTVVLLACFTNELKDRIKKGDFDRLLQDELNESKTVSGIVSIDTDVDYGMSETEEKSTVTLNDEDDYKTVDPHEIRTSTAGTDLSDLSFDEELKIIIERSKHEIRNTDNVITNDATNVNEDVDDELAIVLERSKYDFHGLTGDCNLLNDSGISDTSDYLPLMQYHCSDGGSLHNTKFKDKNKGRELYEYRPKMNRNKSSTSSSIYTSNWRDLLGSSESQKSVLEKPNKISLTVFDASFEPSRQTEGSYSKSSVDEQLCYDLDSKSNKRICVGSRIGKRKFCDKNSFSFQSSIDCGEDLLSSRSDIDVTSCKKAKPLFYNFTPSKDCIQLNVNKPKISRKTERLKSRQNSSSDKTDSVINNVGTEHTSRKMCPIDRIVPSKTHMNYDFLSLPLDKRISDSVKSIVHDTDNIHAGVNQAEIKKKKSLVSSPLNSAGTDDNNSDVDLFTDSGGEADDKNEVLIKDFGNGPIINKNKLEDFNLRFHELKPGSFESNSGYFDTNSKNRNLTKSASFSSDTDDSTESLPDIVPYLEDDIESVKHEIIDVSNSQSSSQTSKHSSHDLTTSSSHQTDTKHFVDNLSDKISLVISILPHVDKLKVRDVLMRCDRNVETCITELLDDST